MASVRNTTEQASVDTDAEWQSWVNMVSAALTAAGLPKTADTGQITIPATITRAQNGYEIRKLNDAHDGTNPIRFKIKYETVATVRPGLTFDLGTGSDGAGNLTGVIFTAQQCHSGNNQSTSALADTLISVGEGHLHIFWLPIGVAAYSNSAWWFSFERAMDQDGVLHPEEGALILATPGNGYIARVYAHGFGITTQFSSASGNNGLLFPRDSTNFMDDIFNDQIGMFPVPWMIRSKVRWARHVMQRGGRLTYGSVVPADHLGAPRTFFSLDQFLYSNWISGGGSGGLSAAVCIPWYV